MRRFEIVQLDKIPPNACPCGQAHRAFAGSTEGLASVHWVEVSADAHAHYHRKLTEFYVVLEDEGQVELDGQLLPVAPLTAVLIKPGCRHRAMGRLKILNLVIPAFDPADEFVD
jgi:mannose-6-phosphate isomerase-like protein (cupin superfamily)